LVTIFDLQKHTPMDSPPGAFFFYGEELEAELKSAKVKTKQQGRKKWLTSQ